jgi:hypothetical protein
MRDWEKLVRERLERGRGGGALEPEVVEELAQHLEDATEAILMRGCGEAEAARQAWGEVRNWNRLAKEIAYVKEGEEMRKQRIRTLWLPGLVTTAVAMALLNAGMRAGIQPRMVWFSAGVFIQFYVPWLIVLPLVGAWGAYWSRSHGGSVAVRATAALFTAVTTASIFMFAMPLAVLVDRHVPWSTVSAAWATSMVGWVLVPGAALFLGALPFLRGKVNEDQLRAKIA